MKTLRYPGNAQELGFQGLGSRRAVGGFDAVLSRSFYGYGKRGGISPAPRLYPRMAQKALLIPAQVSWGMERTSKFSSQIL